MFEEEDDIPWYIERFSSFIFLAFYLINIIPILLMSFLDILEKDLVRYIILSSK